MRQKMTLWSTIVACLCLAVFGVTFLAFRRGVVLSFLPVAMAEDTDPDRSSNRSSSLLNVNDETLGVATDQELELPSTLSLKDIPLPSSSSTTTNPPAGQSPETDSPTEAQTLLPVKTFRLDSIQPAIQTQKYSGIVMARRSSRLAAKHLGRVTRMLVDLGDAVRSGQVLAELDQRELQAEKGVLEAQLMGARSRLEELQRGPRAQEIEQAEALVRQFEATLTLRQANLKRTEDLVESASISKQEYDEALTGLEATEAQLESAQKTLELLREGTRKEQVRSQEAVVQGLESQLEKIQVLMSDLVITAPFDGHVQERLVDEGVIVSPGQPIVEVVETCSLEVHVGVPSHLVKIGALSTARVLCGQQPLPAELVRLSPTIDHRTRNLEAIFALDPECSVLPASNLQNGYSSGQMECRIGQAVDVLISVRSDSSGWWIPTTALVPASRGLWSILVAKSIDGDSGSQVQADASRSQSDSSSFAQGKSRASIIESMQVELLRSSGDWSQVRGALTGSEQLVLSGMHRITSGQRVLAVAASRQEADSVEAVAPEPE